MANLKIGRTKKGKEVSLFLPMINRHGLIAGATGTGKTVTLQYLAEQFSQNGIAVFSADVKGDLSGIALPAKPNAKLQKRLSELNINHYTPQGNPVVFWDIYGKSGHPLRTTISELGPLLLGRLLALNDTQQGVLNALFSYADDKGMLLIDLKDLDALLAWMGEHSASIRNTYGNISTTSIGAIQRGLLTLKEAGGDVFFGEPAFKIDHLFQKDAKGAGVINILDATKLILDGRLYSTFLLWLLSELFESLPEIGDQEKPKLVFFFDEAHLIFKMAPAPLLEKIEQLVRLIRSKGIGVFFITQNPLDISEVVLSQLSNRVQHALRAFTPKDQKSVKAAAETFRKNPKLDTAATIMELGVGEALVSMLDENGMPGIVEQVQIFPPVSQIGAIDEAEKKQIIRNSAFYGVYETPVDRVSAYEMLNNERLAEKETVTQDKTPSVKIPRGRPRQSVGETLIKSTARSLGNSVGKQIVRGILGSIFGKK